MTHLSREETQRYADGELDGVATIESHLRECSECSNAIIAEMQLKHAIRDAATVSPPDVLRARVQRRVSGNERRFLLPVAAAVAAFVLGGLFAAVSTSTRWSTRELADLHATILASANPVDVISTDRHTVKPWFEGRIPFSFPIPELNGTPFHVIGGRVVYAHEQPVAYVMIGKGSHKLSLFVSRVAMPVRTMTGFETVSWRRDGLTYVLVGDVTREDLKELQKKFV